MKLCRFSGWVEKVTYRSGSFYVFTLYVDGHPSLKVKGHLFGLISLDVGVSISLEGYWRKHPKYGNQFNVLSWYPWAESPEDIQLFLFTCIPGFSSEVAQAISTMGPSVFDLLSKGETSTFDSLELNSESLGKALLGWEEANSLRACSEFYRIKGITSSHIEAAVHLFGPSAAKDLKDNPYLWLDILRDFGKVDTIAISLGVKLNDPNRLQAAVLWALHEERKEGHLYLKRGDLVKVIQKIFRGAKHWAPLPPFDIAAITQRLVEQGSVVLEPDVGIYLPDSHMYEKVSADLLARFTTHPEPTGLSDIDLQEFISEYERNNNLRFSEAQREALLTIRENKVLVLTGLPGTGKTTVLRAVVQLFNKAQVKFRLMAPTGIAAKRLASVTEVEAMTIHRALGYDGSKWSRGPDNKYLVGAVVVDEMSMVDQELMYRLLSALVPGTVLVLVGDAAQLPSVSAGNVLRELVSSDIPKVNLTQIFRQSERGEIAVGSHAIHNGKVPTLYSPADKTEFNFVRIHDEKMIVNAILRMVVKLKSRDANFQVMAPKYAGVVGVDNLNECIRDCLNPSGPEEWSGFRLGDRVMVTQNDYRLGVYNGDMGKLVRIGSGELTVRIHSIIPSDPDLFVNFPFELASILKLAYAISIHKSQGCEFNTVIMPLVLSQGRMLQRNLLYTAVTRARNKVWILGEDAAVERAVKNNPAIRRNTNFANAIGVHLKSCKKIV